MFKFCLVILALKPVKLVWLSYRLGIQVGRGYHNHSPKFLNYIKSVEAPIYKLIRVSVFGIETDFNFPCLHLNAYFILG